MYQYVFSCVCFLVYVFLHAFSCLRFLCVFSCLCFFVYAWYLVGVTLAFLFRVSGLLFFVWFFLSRFLVSALFSLRQVFSRMCSFWMCVRFLSFLTVRSTTISRLLVFYATVSTTPILSPSTPCGAQVGRYNRKPGTDLRRTTPACKQRRALRIDLGPAPTKWLKNCRSGREYSTSFSLI